MPDETVRLARLDNPEQMVFQVRRVMLDQRDHLDLEDLKDQ